MDAPEEILLDLNQIAATQSFVAVGAFEVSATATCAYSLDNNGFRAYTLHIKDLRTGQRLSSTSRT